MLEQAITEWRNAALAEGERNMLRRMAAQRFGAAAGDALGTLLGEAADMRRLAAIGGLLFDCASADELLRRSGGVLTGAQPGA